MMPGLGESVTWTSLGRHGHWTHSWLWTSMGFSNGLLFQLDDDPNHGYFFPRWWFPTQIFFNLSTLLLGEDEANLTSTFFKGVESKPPTRLVNQWFKLNETCIISMARCMAPGSWFPVFFCFHFGLIPTTPGDSRSITRKRRKVGFVGPAGFTGRNRSSTEESKLGI